MVRIGVRLGIWKAEALVGISFVAGPQYQAGSIGLPATCDRNAHTLVEKGHELSCLALCIQDEAKELVLILICGIALRITLPDLHFRIRFAYSSSNIQAIALSIACGPDDLPQQRRDARVKLPALILIRGQARPHVERRSVFCGASRHVEAPEWAK